MDVRIDVVLASFCCCDKQHDQKPLRGGQGSFGFIHLGLNPSLREVRAGGDLRKSLQQKL